MRFWVIFFVVMETKRGNIDNDSFLESYAIIGHFFIALPFDPVKINSSCCFDICHQIITSIQLPWDGWIHAQDFVNDVIQVRKIENHLVIDLILERNF